ncbi:MULTISPECIES: hypothetical protein [Streptococcus]|uniref:hypothetical protein n=1 Tax=Streptococcus TaxID=1301 RepID=UPI00069F8CE8|nr:hypothetical protein [Streptococcus anginosus]MCW1059633.1 hypothetical protein [Streptococcus anginosus]MDB8656954.1 hypothetical protein [Streptococcus anginosus]MDU3554683.1 hypothetical protein [Streptococcus anginosus]MDX5003659.1 hypothetical protein [Streptococcus anginosus]MDX5014691.1 hypothetical protein [Streptococcus anginosus]
MENWLQILSSGTLITALITLIQFNKKNNLEYITKERSEWRKGIRLIIADLLADRNRRLAISRLKAQINPYGINLPDESKDYYMKDGHIWKLLNSFTYNEEDCEKLSRYLELLLKYDWERSKNEIKICFKKCKTSVDEEYIRAVKHHTSPKKQ